MEKLVKQKLEQFPNFRERKERAKYLVILALRHCELEGHYNKGGALSPTQLSDFAIAYDSYRHAWTDLLRDNEELRGSDYEDKEVLVQRKQIELGYIPARKDFDERMAKELKEFDN